MIYEGGTVLPTASVIHESVKRERHTMWPGTLCSFAPNPNLEQIDSHTTITIATFNSSIRFLVEFYL